MKKYYLEAGKIVKTHGLNGEVKVWPCCDSPEFLCNFSDLYLFEKKLKIKIDYSQVYKSAVLIKFSGIDKKEQAEKLVGELLYILKKDAKLKRGRYFVQDIIGSSVYDVDTRKKYGLVTEVLKTGANDVYEIKSESQKTYLIPVIESVVIDINIEKKEILIRPMEGIFDDAN
jgi:16S rRNA processing protein RimM